MTTVAGATVLRECAARQHWPLSQQGALFLSRLLCCHSLYVGATVKGAVALTLRAAQTKPCRYVALPEIVTHTETSICVSVSQCSSSAASVVSACLLVCVWVWVFVFVSLLGHPGPTALCRPLAFQCLDSCCPVHIVPSGLRVWSSVVKVAKLSTV